jgi:hypothetical protein
MDSEKITKEIINIERDLDLFEFKIDDSPIWDYIRTGLWENIKSEKYTSNNSSPQFEVSYTDIVRNSLPNISTKTALLADSADILFHGFNRRQKLHDGQYWCIHCDPLAENINLSYEFLESPRVQTKYVKSGQLHNKPAKTNDLKYTDIFEFMSIIYKYKAPDIIKNKLKCDIPAQFDKAEKRINQTFGTDIQIKNLVSLSLIEKKTQFPFYTRILKQVDPECVITVNRSAKLPFIEACSKLEIPTIELQQGAVHSSHIGYSYPISKKLSTIPDYYFSFGDYWSQVIDLPIADENVRSVGWPYLEMQSQRYSENRSSTDILIISQPVESKRLAKFAVDLSNLVDCTLDIVFRPHPNISEETVNTYSILDDSTITVDNNTSLYQAFSEANALVGVSSTALFEGAYFDLQTYILDGFGSPYVKELLKSPNVYSINKPEELITTYSAPHEQVNSGELFSDEPFKRNIDNIHKIVSNQD